MVKKIIMNGYIILDSGSGVSLFPAHYQADNSMDAGSGSLGGSLQTTGTRKVELIAPTTDGEEVLLQHKFIVGNVTSCLVSLGQLYQSGWTIHKDDNSNRLSLQSPGNEISIPVECKNRSFAIKAHVRQISDVMSSANMALGGNDELMVGTVVCAGVKLKIHL